MKFIKWKILTVTCIVCLLPIIFGVALWDRLPQSIAIHFDVHNKPDNFASKEIAVFGLPALMALLQVVCCLINDVNAHKHGERKKFELVTKWIIPAMSVILQIVTLGYALGWNIDVGAVASLIVGCIFMVIGNYLPKFDYFKNAKVDSSKTRKINRFIGYLSVIMGLFFLVSVFLPGTATLWCIFLLIPYTVICVIYSVIVIKKKNE
ncbi:MAG: DUF1648 domain-containing protein [Clostridia bacterium]|nr:DUF1648 domain-containing protein [Clostridia bacterium]